MGYKPLTDIEIKYVIDNYAKLNYNELSEKLNVSKARIVAQCNILQKEGILPKKEKRYNWTFKEEQRLLELLDLSIKDISKIMNKSIDEIISKLKQMRKKEIISKKYKIIYVRDTSNFSLDITDWSFEEEKQFLIKIKNMGLIKLSKELNKSTFDTIMKYYSLKEINPNIETYWNCKDYTEWTKEEDLYLIEHFSNSFRENIIDNLTIKDWKKITRRAKVFGLVRDTHGTKYKSPNEKIVEKILNELNIEYVFQKRIDYKKNKFYIVDFIINGTNIILEAQGDYWHGNPITHPNPSKTQLEKIANDKKRKSILEDMGYKVIYLWEYDLINNYEQCKNIIKSFASSIKNSVNCEKDL